MTSWASTWAHLQTVGPDALLGLLLMGAGIAGMWLGDVLTRGAR
jgi:hypothetical protein